jgi:hypothetical protein
MKSSAKNRIYRHIRTLVLFLFLLMQAACAPITPVPTATVDQPVVAATTMRAISATFDCDLVTSITPDECRGLVALYAATGGANWNNNDGWLTDMNPCEWKGVDCLPDHEHVTLVSLVQNNLGGTLPNEIMRLQWLRVLLLPANSLSGPIPNVMGELKDLETIHLSHNSFTGPIPESLGGLGKLTDIDLSRNQLNGPLPSSLGDMLQLEHLRLGSNPLGAPDPMLLRKLRNLETLGLDGIGWSGEIPVQLGFLRRLTHLDLSNNELTGRIPFMFAGLESLTFLALSQNTGLTGALPVQICSLVANGQLDLLISGTGITAC